MRKMLAFLVVALTTAYAGSAQTTAKPNTLTDAGVIICSNNYWMTQGAYALAEGDNYLYHALGGNWFTISISDNYVYPNSTWVYVSGNIAMSAWHINLDFNDLNWVDSYYDYNYTDENDVPHTLHFHFMDNWYDYPDDLTLSGIVAAKPSVTEKAVVADTWTGQLYGMTLSNSTLYGAALVAGDNYCYMGDGSKIFYINISDLLGQAYADGSWEHISGDLAESKTKFSLTFDYRYGGESWYDYHYTDDNGPQTELFHFVTTSASFPGN